MNRQATPTAPAQTGPERVREPHETTPDPATGRAEVNEEGPA